MLLSFAGRQALAELHPDLQRDLIALVELGPRARDEPDRIILALAIAGELADAATLVPARVPQPRSARTGSTRQETRPDEREGRASRLTLAFSSRKASSRIAIVSPAGIIKGGGSEP
jgi:hypothetical protein